MVPTCKNKSLDVPPKIFVTVPARWDRRVRWFNSIEKATGVKRIPRKGGNLFCCEDHFDVREISL